MKTYNISLDSLSALADIAEKADPSDMSRNKDVKFSSCTFEQALSFARKGWPGGARKAKDILAQIIDKIPELRSDSPTGTYLDVSGSYVDIGEYVNGSPECMVNFQEDKRATRFMHIVVSASYSGYFPIESAINRGVAIAAIIDILESRNIRREVDLIMCAGAPNGDKAFISLPIKQAHHPLNLDTLAFGIAHPAYLRRLIFAVMEGQSAKFRSDFSVAPFGGYGRPIQPPAEPGPTTLVFPTPFPDEDWSIPAAIERTLSALKPVLGDLPCAT